jgi:hypothetical protein
MFVHVVFDNRGGGGYDRTNQSTLRDDENRRRVPPNVVPACRTDRRYTPADEKSRAECRCCRPLERPHDRHHERIGRNLVEIKHDRSVPVHLDDVLELGITNDGHRVRESFCKLEIQSHGTLTGQIQVIVLREIGS